ncbi:MAG: BlaI/MecI/CopY family transcriptional regulator [Ruthenibacterium sp.]
MKKLPEAEFEIMTALWAAKKPVLRNYFDAAFRESHNWADSTILSLLTRLIDKGFIAVKKQGNRNVYTPLVTQKDYLAFENSSFLSRMHTGSVRNLVASMAEGGTLKKQDVDELQALLDSLKGGNPK